ncbi:alpha/beta fold hydrolase [Actinacidiphila bryophytorum]|uniref:Alpha/beta hydrolase family protein n=1 Tax=Actinacidiphila bryophytorum TaxID=1436133 RepID=A0A9W4H5W3_9ACTN|nr:alpha/beta fold hydrolase [Actinacidiphila bryophytorum]MBM9439611.1 alpha/beta hydrolase [Actinacidiphila bryophytorum]MBN6543747.1 alpha/beta hydrolase [Actinacidiphila bryophytorum]CAG7653315.1 Alpha/beta hydrolase family protein [Actinacidiphila bryophytorum]
MATYILVPGADGSAWYWHLVVPELRERGHTVVTVDLPGEDSAGLDAFADAIVAAVHQAAPLPDARIVLVAQSLGGFSAPLICDRVPVDSIVLVNAMVPLPGETAGEWWDNTGQAAGRSAYAEATGRAAGAEFDILTDFFHDVPPEVAKEAMAAPRTGPPAAVFAQPWPLAAWPRVPTRFLQGRDDRFFPLEFQRDVVRERLGIDVETVPGGHLVALSRPRELAAELLKEA